MGKSDIPLTWTVSHEMNHREPPHLPAGMRKALHCLSLLLLPALGSEAQALPRSRPAPRGDRVHGAEPRPYLPAIGSPGLRFQEPAPVPEFVPRPVPTTTSAAASPESSVASANAAAVQSSSPASSEPGEATPATQPSAEAASPTAKTPAPILPDDARPAVRPEDFLPYFQLPGSARHPEDVTLLVPAPRGAPAPAPLPPSSATYIQSPR